MSESAPAEVPQVAPQPEEAAPEVLPVQEAPATGVPLTGIDLPADGVMREVTLETAPGMQDLPPLPAVETPAPPAPDAAQTTPSDAPESQSDEAAAAPSTDTPAPVEPAPAEPEPAPATEAEPTLSVNGEAMTAALVAAILQEVQGLRTENDALRAELAERRAAG